MYSEVCTVEVDLSHLTKKTEDIKKRGLKGKYYQIDYEVALLFGLTELKAQLIWKEKVPYLRPSMLRRPFRIYIAVTGRREEVPGRFLIFVDRVTDRRA